MVRIASLIYGLSSYAVFFATFLYLVGFITGALVPIDVDSGAGAARSVSGLAFAVVIDTALIALFALQHSVMARPAFKTWWTRIVPSQLERSTYVLASSLALVALFLAWQPIPAVVWDIQTPLLRGAIWALFASGVALVLYSTFLIDHFDLFGLRQVARFFLGREYEAKRFMTPSLYKLIRHPIYVGWLIAFWATPTMSAGHLLLALGMTAYIFVAIPLEERDLAAALGEPYRRWVEHTPMLLPRWRRSSGRGVHSAPAR